VLPCNLSNPAEEQACLKCSLYHHKLVQVRSKYGTVTSCCCLAEEERAPKMLVQGDPAA
jgi:hypothetical protein